MFELFRITLFHLCADTKDFHLSTTELIFDANTTNGTTKSFVISIHDDNLVEGTETFVISGSVTSPAMFLPGKNMTTITIVDNERKCRTPLFSDSAKSIPSAPSLRTKHT